MHTLHIEFDVDVTNGQYEAVAYLATQQPGKTAERIAGDVAKKGLLDSIERLRVDLNKAEEYEVAGDELEAEITEALDWGDEDKDGR